MGATVAVTPEVREVLERATISVDRVALPPGQLDRGLYVAVNKVLEAAGGKWDKRAKAHLFARDPRPVLGLVVSDGTIDKVVDEKKLYQAFYTPAAVAADLVRRAGIRPGMRVLEPSAGDGAIARAIRDAGGDPECMEIRECEAEKLRAAGFSTLCADFMQHTANCRGWVDACVMNPPFTKDQDIRHVLHALEFLKPGGKLVAIMSPGFTFGGSKIRTSFREMVDERGWRVEELPEGTFHESGTEVRTVILEARA